MKTDRQKLGKAGEEMAATYLQEKGYEIIERNFQAGQNEIDLICLDGNDLVIVEVKSVRTPGYGKAEARVSLFKQRSVIKATYIYLNRHRKFTGKGVRFDVVCINLRTYPADVAHYKGAFWQQRF
jgi:putative endonuclease